MTNYEKIKAMSIDELNRKCATMATELEEQFFKVFGIEPFCDLPCNKRGIECTDNTYCGNKYPDITAEKLLQMICIILNAEGLLTINTEGNIEDIKDFVLRFLIGKVNKNNPYCHYKTKNKIKQQIQQLFKEEKE